MISAKKSMLEENKSITGKNLFYICQHEEMGSIYFFEIFLDIAKIIVYLMRITNSFKNVALKDAQVIYLNWKT